LMVIVACLEAALFSCVNFSWAFLGFNRRRGGPLVSRKDFVHRGLLLVVSIQAHRSAPSRGIHSGACQLGLGDRFQPQTNSIYKVKFDRSQAAD
jgi:hypothetical protein